MSSKQEPLIINNWEQGIADSPHKGFGLFKNADIESIPGSVKVQKKPGSIFHSITTQTFTAAVTDICTASGSVESTGANFNGAAVYFTTTGTLPAGLSINTVYFLYKVSGSTFKVYSTYKGSAGSGVGGATGLIDITDTGTGTHTMTQVAIGLVRHIVKDPGTSTYYLSTSNGRTWFKPSGERAYLLHNSAIDTGSTSVTNGSGRGLAISSFSSTTQTFLFVFRNQVIDSIDVNGTTAIEALAWQNGWGFDMHAGLGSSNSHYAIEAQDAAIYYCDDRFIGSIIEKVDQVFSNTNAATYTHNPSALDLPPGEIAECLAELGTNLLIGGKTFNKIYPWDRVSDSFTLAIGVPENNIQRMVNIGGTVYIAAGTWGNIYITQGSYVKPFKKLPFYVTNNGTNISTSPVTWGDMKSMNGTILVGASSITTGNAGIWRIWPDGRMVIDNQPSTGSANVTAIYAEDTFYYFGYDGGADSFNSIQYSTSLYDNYETVIQSALYKVATSIEKGAFSHLEVLLDQIATAGNVRISYRTNLSASFTTIATYTMDSTNFLFSTPDIGLIDIENIQIQVEMNDGASSGADNRLNEVRLLP